MLNLHKVGPQFNHAVTPHEQLSTCSFFIVHSKSMTPIMLLHYILTLLPLRFFSPATPPIDLLLYLHKYIYSGEAAASARVK